MKKSCVVIPHNGLGDNINSVSMCKYLSTIYEKVYHICRHSFYENIILFYSEYKNIEVYKLDCDYNKNFFVDGIFKIVDDVYLLGIHQNNKYKITIEEYTNIIGDIKLYDVNIPPICFYNMVNINPNIYFHYDIPDTEESNRLYDLIKNLDYIFIHNSSSSGINFSNDSIIEKFDINPDEILIINPCINYYSKDHKFHNIANKFVMKLLISYKKTIENASSIILSNSCFFCLSLQLNIKSKNIFYWSKYNYDYLYNKKYNYKNKILSIKNITPNQTALGIGDLIISCVLFKNNILDYPQIINKNYFLNKNTYPAPQNSFDFRIKLLEEIVAHNNLEKKCFIVEKLKCMKLNQHLSLYPKIKSFKLNMPFKNNIYSEPYIIFHTKCRFLGDLEKLTEYNIEILKKFYKKFKSKYKIILLGEREMPETYGTKIHKIKTIYNELLLLKTNNNIIDMTKDIIYNNLNYENYLKDISIVHWAKYNIHFGLGGQFVSSLVFGNNIINYIPKKLQNMINIYNFDDNLLNYIEKIENTNCC